MKRTGWRPSTELLCAIAEYRAEAANDAAIAILSILAHEGAPPTFRLRVEALIAAARTLADDVAASYELAASLDMEPSNDVAGGAS